MKKIFFSILLFFCLFVSPSAKAQPYFHRNDNVPVKINGDTLKFPWAGGLNFIQASKIDLNMDGVKDLFIFDRTGNKIRTFIYDGTPGATGYSYAPQWENFFPYLHDWALLVDYNCDNKEDIFSFSEFGGIKVFKNVSTTQFGLQFQLVDTLLHSVYNPDSPSTVPCAYGSSFQCNLYVTQGDIPAIADIDNDGDMDIVTFALGGSCLEYHQNQSEENLFGCDSLLFQIRNRGWGFASESPVSNVFLLHDSVSCGTNVLNPGITISNGTGERTDRHSGNCELCWDLDGDADKEIIIGNVYFNNLAMITNGGTPLQSNFIANDLAFPFNNGSSPAIDLTLMPCAYKVDVDNDGVNDLLVSPNAPNQSENFNSVLYYKNTGTNSIPSFQFQQYNFLQDNMIDVGEGAYPVFFDYDNDGLQDLFIGNHNYFDTTHHGNQIAQFHNIGTLTNPMFDLVTRDYDNMSQLTIINMIPTFGDLDGDGDADMIIGGEQGRVYYFQNIATAGNPAQFVLTMPNLKNTLNHYIDVGDNATPQIIDVDGDGKKDLVIGGRRGNLTYLHHTGTGTETVPLFDSITNVFGGVHTRIQPSLYGNSYPCLFKQGTVTKMLVGQEGGYIRFYDSIDGNLGGTFNQVDSMYEGIFQGQASAPNVADIDNDGFKDLVVGNYEGGVTYYKGAATLNGITEIPTKFTWTYTLFPNPANNSITLKINNDVASAGYSIEVVNLFGQLITSEQITNNIFILNTQNFISGMYFFKVSEINTNGGIKSGALIKRVVIQH